MPVKMQITSSLMFLVSLMASALFKKYALRLGSSRHEQCFRGRPAGNDPWDAWTLEWVVTSPPPPYNFAKLPVVRSRRPLWDFKHPDDPDWKYE